MLTVSLCEGRHAMPPCVTGSIFPNMIDMTDADGVSKHAADWVLSHCNVLREYRWASDKEYTDVLIQGYTGDPLTVYVTGASIALAGVVFACAKFGVHLTLMHYDRETGGYFPQQFPAINSNV